jgi:hypothetical protein
LRASQEDRQQCDDDPEPLELARQAANTLRRRLHRSEPVGFRLVDKLHPSILVILNFNIVSHDRVSSARWR